MKNSWKWANPLISGNVCTKEWETKHSALFSLVGGCYRLESFCRALHLLALALLWLWQESRQSSRCSGKCSARTRANQCQEQWLTFERGWECGAQMLFSLAQQCLIAQDMGHSHKVRGVFVISTQKKNGLGKLTDCFLAPLSPSFKQDSTDEVLPHHILPPFSPDVCHVFGYVSELHIGKSCPSYLPWLWGGLWQNKPLIEDKFWCTQFLPLDFEIKGTR